ncbi:hypothetical protein [Caulobacter phage KcrB]|nr:hypothetical protein RW_GP041 [Caulobacter phage RW]WCA46345.1 hypothetical protein [Caulobacter phage KcrB]WCD56280.1 hypothetical protein [Caulobacter phage RLK]WNV48072.1 hypothetical protein GB2A_gp040 [Caulobacter phage GB2A]
MTLTETQAAGMSDAPLIDAALKGDAEAVRELAKRYEDAKAEIEVLEDELDSCS